MNKRMNMSNDEAVEWLLSLKNLDICGENRKTAIDKAVTALEAQPCTEDYPTCTESEIIKEVIVMLLNHIRTDGQLAHFSFSEVRWLEAMKKKLTSGGGEDGKDSTCD